MERSTRPIVPTASPTLDVLAILGAFFFGEWLLGFIVGDLTPVLALSFPLVQFPWTLITSVYAHGSLGHLLGNALLIGLLGVLLERVTSRVRFHLFFLTSGSLSGLIQTLVTGGAVIGASGAAFALLGYLITGNRVTDTLLSAFSIPLRWQLAGLVLLAGGVTLLTYAPGVALIGHFTGMAVGLVAGRLGVLDVKHNG